MKAQDLPSSRLGQSISPNRHRVITKYGPSIIQTISDWVNLWLMAKPDMTQSLWSSKNKKIIIHTLNSAPCQVSVENAAGNLRYKHWWNFKPRSRNDWYSVCHCELISHTQRRRIVHFSLFFVLLYLKWLAWSAMQSILKGSGRLDWKSSE